MPEYFTPTNTWGVGFGGASRQEAVGVLYLEQWLHFCQGKGVIAEYTTWCWLSGVERVHFTCECDDSLVNDGGAVVLYMMALVSGAT